MIQEDSSSLRLCRLTHSGETISQDSLLISIKSSRLIKSPHKTWFMADCFGQTSAEIYMQLNIYIRSECFPAPQRDALMIIYGLANTLIPLLMVHCQNCESLGVKGVHTLNKQWKNLPQSKYPSPYACCCKFYVFNLVLPGFGYSDLGKILRNSLRDCTWDKLCMR